MGTEITMPLGNKSDDTVAESTNDCDSECCPICYEPFLRLDTAAVGEGDNDNNNNNNNNNSSTASEDTLEDSKLCTGECLCYKNKSIDVNVYNKEGGVSTCVDSSTSRRQLDNRDEFAASIHVDTDTDTNTSIDIDIDIDIANDGEHHRLQQGRVLRSRDRQCKKTDRYPHPHPHPHPRDRVIIPGCGHAFCRGCLREHCSYAVSVRNIPIRCPGHASDCSNHQCCSSDLPIDIIKDSLLLSNGEILSEAEDHGDIEIGPAAHPIVGGSDNNFNQDWIKFQRLQKMLEDPSLTPCTRCGELVSPDRTNEIGGSGAAHPNRLECPVCNHVFCRIYGDAHHYSTSTTTTTTTDSSTTMDAASRRKRKQESKDLRKTESVIRKSCKPCSHCGIPIERDAGCDHIICPNCHNDMCYNCGTHVYLTGDSMVRECSKCQKSYIDHRHIRTYRLCIAVWLPFLAPIYISYMAMTLSMTVLSFGFCCCLGCGVRRRRREKEPNSEDGHSHTRSGLLSNLTFMPVTAAREVMGFVFLPVVDLFRSCGVPCCFCNNAPGLCRGYYEGDDSDDSEEEYSDGDDETNKNDDTEGIDDSDYPDEESQWKDVLQPLEFIAIDRG